MAWRPYLANTVADTEYLQRCEATTGLLGDLGATIEPMGDDLEPTEPYWLDLSTALWNARFADTLPKWRDKLSPTLLSQMSAGHNQSGEMVGRAILARTKLYRQVQSWFERFDIIAMPTLARTAIGIDENFHGAIEIEGREIDTVRRAWYPYTHPFNLTGNPAISLPAGLHSDGLPVSLQLVARRGDDALLLRVAALLEAVQPWSSIRPNIYI